MSSKIDRLKAAQRRQDSRVKSYRAPAREARARYRDASDQLEHAYRHGSQHDLEAARHALGTDLRSDGAMMRAEGWKALERKALESRQATQRRITRAAHTVQHATEPRVMTARHSWQKTPHGWEHSTGAARIEHRNGEHILKINGKERPVSPNAVLHDIEAKHVLPALSPHHAGAVSTGPKGGRFRVSKTGRRVYLSSHAEPKKGRK